MKANAPKKIYIHPDIGGREFLRPWLHRAANNESVEYTRTDAFIEKATWWLKENADMYEAFDSESESYYMDKDKLVEDFEEYLKK